MMEASNSMSTIEYQDVRYVVSSMLHDGTDTELAGANYSSANNTGRYTSTGNTILTGLVLELNDTDVAQDTANVYDFIDAEGMLIANTPLTNGFTMGVKRSDGTTLVDIAEVVPIKSMYQLIALARSYYVNTATESATSTANMTVLTCLIDFKQLFGTGLLLRDGDYFFITCKDDLTGLSMTGQVFGYEVE